MLAKLTKLQRILVAAIAFILLSTVCIFAVIFFFNKSMDGKIYPNINIDGVDVGHKTKKEALKLVDKKTDYYQNAIVEVLYDDIKIATFSGKELALDRDSDIKVDQAYLVGRSPDFSSKLYQQVTSMLGLRQYGFDTKIRYDLNKVESFLESSEDIYNIPAKDALFTFENGRVTSFRKDEFGKQIRSEKFVSDFHKEIQEIENGKKNVLVELENEPLKPKITLAESNNFGIEEFIGKGVSDYSHSIASRIHNVILAASKFDGVIIPKDSEFSFNEIIGDISAQTGYQQAYVIKNGRTVLGDGGGVCQVSTTMFRAALNTGLPITDRNAHAYRVSYYENDSEPGFDATIFSPTVDLKFKNDTGAAILIQTEVDKAKNILTFNFYGKKDARVISISEGRLGGVVPPPEPLYEDDPTLEKGVVKQVDFASWGANASFDYKVTGEDGKIIQEKTFYSNYRPWRAVFLRGTKE